MSTAWKNKQFPILAYVLVFFIHVTVKGQAEQEFKETVYFKSGSFALDAAESQKLFLILRDTNYLIGKLKITGFTDSVGAYQVNRQLSFKRSESVVEWF